MCNKRGGKPLNVYAEISCSIELIGISQEAHSYAEGNLELLLERSMQLMVG